MKKPAVGLLVIELHACELGSMAQSVVHLSQEPDVLGLIPGPAISPSTDSRRVVVSYWQKYVPEVLVNWIAGLSLSRKSVVRSTDHPDMTINVYRGHKTTQQQQQNLPVTILMSYCSS